MEQNFRTLDDEQLRALIKDIQAELTARDKKRKAEAAKRIKAMADAAGLTVSVAEKGKKKRGRPPKVAGQ